MSPLFGEGELRVTGQAGTEEVVDARVTFISPGTPDLEVLVSLFPSFPSAEPVEVVERFTLPEGLLADARLTARVVVLTESGLESDPLVVPVGLPVEVARGGVCDLPARLERSCAPADVCLDLDGEVGPNDPVCADRLGACPAGWGVVDLDAAVDPAGGWSVAGDNALAPYRAEGTCDRGNGKADVYVFTAAVAGSYTFSTDQLGPNVDTVMIARTACIDPAPEAEVGCDDDGAGNLRSEIDVVLEANESVFLFVAQYSDARGGAYTLRGRLN